jgi:hypothetical protein
MAQEKLIDTKVLIEEARALRDKEAYQLLENTQSVRIGVGARCSSSITPSFFVEVIVKLSTENTEVDLKKLEKVLRLLEALQKKGYILTYQDDVSISCETTTEINQVNNEYSSARALIGDKGLLRNDRHPERAQHQRFETKRLRVS